MDGDTISLLFQGLIGLANGALLAKLLIARWDQEKLRKKFDDELCQAKAIIAMLDLQVLRAQGSHSIGAGDTLTIRRGSDVITIRSSNTTTLEFL